MHASGNRPKFVNLQAALDMLTAVALKAKIEQACPLAVVGLKTQSRIAEIVRDGRQFVRAFQLRQIALRGSPLTPVSCEVQRRIGQLRAQRHGSRVGLAGFLGSRAFDGDLHRTEGDQERKFELPAKPYVGQIVQEFESIGEVARRFEVRRTLARTLSGHLPVPDSFLSQPGARAMVGEQLGLVGHSFRKVTF